MTCISAANVNPFICWLSGNPNYYDAYHEVGVRLETMTMKTKPFSLPREVWGAAAQHLHRPIIIVGMDPRLGCYLGHLACV